MHAYEKKTGGSVLAISHNGNLSNGLMFPVVEAVGKKIDREYVETGATALPTMAPATTPPTTAPGHHQPHQASALFDVANAVAITVAAATMAIRVFLMEFTRDQDAQLTWFP